MTKTIFVVIWLITEYDQDTRNGLLFATLSNGGAAYVLCFLFILINSWEWYTWWTVKSEKYIEQSRALLSITRFYCFSQLQFYFANHKSNMPSEMLCNRWLYCLKPSKCSVLTKAVSLLKCGDMLQAFNNTLLLNCRIKGKRYLLVYMADNITPKLLQSHQLQHSNKCFPHITYII